MESSCGRDLVLPPRGRRPRYCSRSCQARAYRVHTSQRAAAQAEGADAAPAPERLARGEDAPRPGVGLSRERITEAALVIADADSINTMSMRNVAQALGVNVMSLYHYFEGKDELIDLMVESVFSRDLDLLPAEPQGWRPDLESSARWEWSLYSRHPWLLEVIATVRPPLAPSLLAGFERGLRALDGLGLSTVTAHRLYLGVSGLVQGLALLRVSEITAKKSESRGEGVSLNQWRSATFAAVYDGAGSERYPRQAALRNTPAEAEVADVQEIFEFSLHRHLDGIALFLSEEAARTGGRAPRHAPAPQEH